jgi:Major Facilitator Superfamily
MFKPVTKLTKIRAVVCPMLINFCIGAYYNYSNLNPYIAKYMGVTPDDTIVVNQIWLLNQSLFSIVGVKLSEKIGYWKVNYIAFSLFALLHLVVSFIPNPTIFVGVYGFFAGAFAGLGYLPALYIAWTYFPNTKSVATGAILFCAGMSASILSPLSTYVVNPENLPSTDPRYGDRVPQLFRFLAIYFGVLCLVGCTLQPGPLESDEFQESQKVKNDPTSSESLKEQANNEIRSLGSEYNDEKIINKDEMDLIYKDELAIQVGRIGGEEHLLLNAGIRGERVADLIVQQMKYQQIIDESQQNSPIENKKASPRLSLGTNAQSLYKRSQELKEQNCPSVEVGLRSPAFACMAFMAIGCSIFPYFLNSNWKVYYQEKLPDISDSKMSFILSFGAVANSSIRLIVGILLLRVDVKHIYYFLVCNAMCCAFTLTEFLTNYEFGVMYVMLAYVNLGSQVTLFPTICTMVFGSSVGPKIYPYIYLCFSVSNFSQYFAYKFYGKHGHMETIYYIFGAMAFFGLMVAILFSTKPDWTKSIYREKMKQIENDGKNKPLAKQA